MTFDGLVPGVDEPSPRGFAVCIPRSSAPFMMLHMSSWLAIVR